MIVLLCHALHVLESTAGNKEHLLNYPVGTNIMHTQKPAMWIAVKERTVSLSDLVMYSIPPN